jgi:hypothetical protein
MGNVGIFFTETSAYSWQKWRFQKKTYDPSFIGKPDPGFYLAADTDRSFLKAKN